MAIPRRWLMLSPHPTRIRARLKDGDERVVRIGDARSRWRDAEKALSQAVTAEALDASGEVLRVWDPDDDTDAPGASRGGLRMGELAELGRIISEAADASALRHADAYKLAYEQQALLVRVLSERLQMLERAWHRLLVSQATVEQGDGEQQNALLADPNFQMVSSLLANAIGPQLLSGLGLTPPGEPPKKGAPSNGAK